MKNYIITVSREFGSGGRTIGKKAAEKLGIPCYDSELIQKIALESGFSENFVKDVSEDAPVTVLGLALIPRTTGKTNDDYIWEAQTKVVNELAKKGACVIVGRCADYILKGKVDCLRVFVHADMDYRSKRIVEIYGEHTETPEQRLREKDKRRAAYHRFYTGMKWGYAQNYDITMNSGILGIEECVDILVNIYRKK